MIHPRVTRQIVGTDGLMAVGFFNQTQTNILYKFDKTMMDFPARQVDNYQAKVQSGLREVRKPAGQWSWSPVDIPPTLRDICGLMYDVNTNVVTTQTGSHQQRNHQHPPVQTNRNGPQ